MEKPGSEEKIPGDYIVRKHGSSPIGTTLFVILRLLDLPLQYALLTQKLGAYILQLLRTRAVTPQITRTTVLDLTPYQLAVFAMAMGTTIKHIFWVLYISQLEMPVAAAVMIPTFNTVFNSVNSLLSICVLTSGYTPAYDDKSIFLSPTFAIGVLLYIAGMLLETISELQRKQFKGNPANKGKPYSGGLFAWASHINYGGFAVCRFGYGLVCAGWAWATVVVAWLGFDFGARAAPVLEEYCYKKYGDAYSKAVEKTRYKLIPGIY
ncbi:hypothetical protein GP486_004148 [Trichoglossum hirsutum]|uniref:Steroid 5-alpha reductase C-terminal domain-containing protein n=1 Tax=Trichoglossum hirsutum TaxID=265104 RepID=A0A9P8LBJ0_9PEZI|nr:hypothetical protein GP486_004148 [Trichoglossum hirsutum]